MKEMHARKPSFQPLKVLRVDSSARREGSVTRRLGSELLKQLEASEGPIELKVRDLAVESPPFIDAAWVEANFTPEEQRSTAQNAVLASSDALVAELMTTDVLIIGVPIYNFGIPATLKAWIDMVARARLTFRYTENGPVGLLRGKRAFLVVASGGTAATSAIDFATGYLLHMLRFLGIEEIEIIAADRLKPKGENNAMADARRRIERLLPAPRSLAATA